MPRRSARAGASARPLPARRCSCRAEAPPRPAPRPAARGPTRRRCGSRGAPPSPSSAADTASSKSRAVAGSTVKVARSRQVSPSGRRPRWPRSPHPGPRPRAPAGIRGLPPGPKAARRPRRCGRSAEPSVRSALAPAGPKSTRASSPGPHPHRAAAQRRLGTALEQRLGDGEATPPLDGRDPAPERLRAPRAHLFSTAAFSARTASAFCEPLVRGRLRVVRRRGRPA